MSLRDDLEAAGLVMASYMIPRDGRTGKPGYLTKPYLMRRDIAEDEECVIHQGLWPTSWEVASFCDQNAENSNSHDLCGIHETLLRSMINAKLERHKIMSVLMEIARHGHLGKLRDAYREG